MKKITRTVSLAFTLLTVLLNGCAPTPSVPLTSTYLANSATLEFTPTATPASTKTSTPSPKSVVTIYADPGNIAETKSLSQSKDFSVKVNGTTVFVYEAGQSWSFFNFAFANTNVKVDVTVNGTIKDWQVRPVASGVTPAQSGNTFSFTFSQPEKLILQINGRNGQKLLISAEAPETDVPNPSDPSVLYYGPGVHYMGYKFTPAANIHTIYLAGGAVVRGTLRIENREDLKIIGRGIFAMGEWPHDEQEGLNLHFINGLVVDGITIVDSPGWQLSVGGGNNIIVRNVKLLATKTHYNTDGIQMWQQSHVSVSDFFVLANDDSLPIGPGASIVEVKNGMLWNNTNGGSFMLGWGGGGDVHDVLYDNIDVLENGCNWCGVFSARWGDISHGLVSGVTYRNIRIENAVHTDGTKTRLIDWVIGPSQWSTGSKGQIENINFENISFPNGGAKLQGSDVQNGISHIQFINSTISGVPLTNKAQLGMSTYFTGDISTLFGSQASPVTPSPFPTVPVMDLKNITSVPVGMELLNDPGFEDGISNWVPYNRATLTLDTELVHSGKYSLKVTRPDRFNGNLQDIYPQMVGQVQGEYTLSAYLRLAAGAGSDNLFSPVIAITDSLGTKFIPCDGSPIDDISWTYVSCVRNLSWTSTLAQISFHVENWVPGDIKTFYVDDLSLKKNP